MKPLKILIFFLAIFSLLFLLTLLFPRDGIAVGEDLKLRFVSRDDIFIKDTIDRGYTDSLIVHTDAVEDPESGVVDTVFLLTDSLPDVQLDSIAQARIDSISQRVYPLELPEKAKEELIAFFYSAEQSKENGDLLRILHYGDSQIENDRMTSLLRYRFQKVFGGYGCGMVPAIPLYFGNPTFRENFTGDWIRYTGFGRRDTTLEHASYGTLSCFTSIPLPEDDEFPSLEFEFLKGRRASKFSSLKLYLHSYVDSSKLVFHLNDTISDTIINLKDGYQVVEIHPGLIPSKVKLEFGFPEGGRVYGISFDPKAGVQVDNIAMRGSSGIEFSRSDKQTLDTMLTDLNPGLVLMQFGGNVVPYINNTNYYKYAFKRELEYVKSLCPEVPVIVIGPSDMSTKENGKLCTYEKLMPVRDALKAAALESGCGFWDMFEAMGGENSIQDFVLADPPLANPDYIHFTPKGANMMAGMFFDAVMLEYEKYKAVGSSQ